MSGIAHGFKLNGPRAPIRMLLSDVWASRDLVRMLARKEFFVRYRRASLGLLWSVGLPAIQAAVMAVVFTRVVRIEVDGNYGVFVYSGLLGWTFFSQVVGTAATSIVDGAPLASKIYFPRAVLPIVTVVSAVYAFTPSVFVLLVAHLAFGGSLGWEVVYLVPAVVLMVALSLSISLVTSGLHVYFRDLRFLVQALLIVWFYATPVIWPLDLASGWFRVVATINPATGMVSLFRESTVGVGYEILVPVLVSVAWAIGLGLIGLVIQHRRDRLFVDLL